MPTNFTENYQLNQWEKSDKVLMEDFNADNTKIDAALKAEADARTALAVEVAKRGNCRIIYQTFIGNGSNTRTFTFPGKPLLVLFTNAGVDTIIAINGALKADCNFIGHNLTDLTWSGNSVTLTDSGTGIMSDPRRTHILVAFIAAD